MPEDVDTALYSKNKTKVKSVQPGCRTESCFCFWSAFLSADQTQKRFVNWGKVLAETKNISDFLGITLVFWVIISTGFREDICICLNDFLVAHQQLCSGIRWLMRLIIQNRFQTDFWSSKKLTFSNMAWVGDAEVFMFWRKLSKPQLNHNSTQPNITSVGLDTKMTLHTTPPPPQKLNVSNISAVPGNIKNKLWRK